MNVQVLAEVITVGVETVLSYPGSFCTLSTHEVSDPWLEVKAVTPETFSVMVFDRFLTVSSIIHTPE